MSAAEKLRFVPEGGRYRVRGPIGVLLQEFCDPNGN